MSVFPRPPRRPGYDAPPPTVSEDGGPAQLIALIVLLALAGIGLGASALWGQQHFIAQRDAGDDLSLPAALIADGSSALTAWPGWIAAACFGFALARLQRGQLEPPAGRTASVAEIRNALRREHRAVHVAQRALFVAAVLDAGRAAVYIAASVPGVNGARDTVLATTVEAAGLIVAAIVLARWVRVFGENLTRIGAL